MKKEITMPEKRQPVASYLNDYLKGSRGVLQTPNTLAEEQKLISVFLCSLLDDVLKRIDEIESRIIKLEKQ